MIEFIMNDEGNLKFKLGVLVITNGVCAAMNGNEKFEDEMIEAYVRYIQCDWGDLCEEDKKMNDEATQKEDRILAKYSTSEGEIYIITEWDRSVTTILFTNEY